MTERNRMMQLNIAWMLVCTGLLILVALLISNYIKLKDELTKPVRLTMQQKHQVITEYLQTMDGETKYALRKHIGCTDKE